MLTCISPYQAFYGSRRLAYTAGMGIDESPDVEAWLLRDSPGSFARVEDKASDPEPVVEPEPVAEPEDKAVTFADDRAFPHRRGRRPETK